MPRKAGPKPELITRGAYRDTRPPCEWCGFDGEANDLQSPFLACAFGPNGEDRDPARHQRTPLGLGVRA